MNKTGRTEHALGLLLCKSRCVCDRAPRIEGSGLLFFMFISVRPGSSDRGRPADVTPPEVDLGGVEALEPQVAEDACLDREQGHGHS